MSMLRLAQEVGSTSYVDKPKYVIRYVGTQLKTAQHALHYLPKFWRAAEMGLRSCLVCSSPPADPRWLEPLLEIGTKIVYLPRPKRNFDLGCVWRAYRLCRSLEAGIFHCDNMHTSPLMGAALAGVPVRLWTKHSMQPCFEAARTPNLRDRIALSVRTSCTLATRVLAVSSAVRNELLAMGVPPERVMVVRNSINDCDLVRSERGAARRALGLAESDFVFSAVGRSAHVKGWDVLIRAFEPIARVYPHTKLLLAGDTTSAAERAHFVEMERLMDRFGVRDRIVLTGYLTELADVWGATDIFVMPSRSEGDSNALIEALCTGQPCIATRVGSAGDLIRDGENGLLVEREDDVGLSAAMQRLVSEPELRRRLSEANRGVRLAPTIEAYAHKMVDIYADLLRDVTGRELRRAKVTASISTVVGMAAAAVEDLAAALA